MKPIAPAFGDAGAKEFLDVAPAPTATGRRMKRSRQLINGNLIEVFQNTPLTPLGLSMYPGGQLATVIDVS
jgi:hypothetical protein